MLKNYPKFWENHLATVLHLIILWSLIISQMFTLVVWCAKRRIEGEKIIQLACGYESDEVWNGQRSSERGVWLEYVYRGIGCFGKTLSLVRNKHTEKGMQLQTFGKLNMCMKKQHLKDQARSNFLTKKEVIPKSLLRGINTVWIQGMMI